MRKRIFAMLVALIMAISLFPVTALAAVEDPVASTSYVKTDPDSAVQIKKSVSEVNNDGTYTLSMEAYVTGQVVTTNPEPLDIVLVLDVSGSMADDISIVTEENVTYSLVKDRAPIQFIFSFDTNTNSYVYSDWKNGGEYWYSENGETFYPITNIAWTTESFSVYYTYTYDKGNGETSTHISSGVSDSPSSIYYKTVKTETFSKMVALQNAVNSFIDTTAKKNTAITDENAKHRISIVKFAGESTNQPGNETYEEGRYSYNYSQIVMGLTTVDDAGASALKDEVNKITPAGATSADYGMAHAKTVLNNRPEGEKTRKQVVIFFTDGEPNHHNGFDADVANTAIGHAKDLKANHATIYTIGVFAGADPTDTESNINKFMHAVSSNYPEAENYTDVGRTPNNKGYYQTATTQGDLTKIFGAIAEDMIPAVTADSHSVLTDTVSNYFTAPNNSADVTVEVYQASGNGEAPVWTEDETFVTTDIKVTVSGQNISVTGFDYSANAVVQKNGSWQGKKLVISFVIAPDAAANWTAGTHPYPTNVAGDNEVNNAGLSYGNEKTALTESPTVLITAYTVAYRYGDTPPAGAPDLPAGGVYLPGTNVTVATAPNLDGYTFSGWSTTDAYVSVSGGMFTMPNNNVILTGTWTKTATDQTYTVTYSWTGADALVTEPTLPTNNNEYPSEDAAKAAVDTTFTNSSRKAGNNGYYYTFSGWTAGETANNNVPFIGEWRQTDDKVDDMWATVTFIPSAHSTLSGETKVTVLKETSWDSSWVPTVTYDEGYEADTTQWTPAFETTVNRDLSYTATEKAKEYSLTIHYVFANDKTKAADDYTDTVNFNDSYSVKSPAIPGYTANMTTVSGTMPASNVEVTVTYTPNPITVRLGDDEGEYQWVLKNLTGSLPKNFEETFTVTLTPVIEVIEVNLDAPVAYAVNATAEILTPITGTVTMTDNGKAAFDFEKPLTFYTDGKYKFTVKETAGSTKNMTYDKTEYTLIVNVTEDLAKGLVATAAPVTVTNKYSNPTPSYNPPVAPKLNKADHYAYVVGYPDGTVQPQGAITRAEVATIFFRLLSDETRDLYWTKDNAYTDIKAGDWFNNAVSTLSNAGIINGYPDGTFRPNAPITRAEMAKVIAMFAELDKDSEGFKDIAGHWAEAYIKLAAGNGWIAGYPDGTFRPNQYITRAETMTMINRVLERVPSEEEHLLSHRVMLTFPDNQPGDWYYIAVQEATNSHTYERYATEKNGDEQWIKLIDNYDWTKLEF